MLCQRTLAVTVMVTALGIACAQKSTGNSAFQGKKLLLVAGLSNDMAKADAEIKGHFESLGMKVTMVSDVNPPPAEGYDLLFLFSDIKAKAITDLYRTTVVPIFTEKPLVA